MDGARIVIGVLSITIVVLVLVLSLLGDPAAAEVPPDPRYESRLIELERGAVERAFQVQVELVFGNWMKDGNNANQPQRALVGVRKAREAYIGAMQALDRRAAQQGGRP